MSESLYRRNPVSNAIDIIKGRRGLLNKNQTVGGKSVQVRNPCYVRLNGIDKSCGGGGNLVLPIQRDTWEKNYGSTFKPKPEIEAVTVEYGGDWGLARKLSATIRCYTIHDFQEVQKYFLLPGNEVSVKFGYKASWGVDQSRIFMDGFKVATFNFNTTDEGYWICNFTAVSSSTAIQNLEMQLVVCNGCNAIGGQGQSGTSGPLKYKTGLDDKQHPVKGVAQLIASDAQKNGQTSIDELQDGEVITGLTNYSPGSLDNSAAIVVYTGDHIRDWADKAGVWIGGIMKKMGIGESEVESTNNQVYVTLAYVVNRIINDQLLRAFTCGIAHERDKFNKVKVEFHPKYSKSKVADGITSGDPLTCLLLGDGNYKNGEGDGKDFDADCKNLGAVKAMLGGGEVKLQNILIHRDVIANAMQDATKTREGEADWTGVKDTKEEVINIMDFFEKIADHISSCVGGAISLRLVENPDNHSTLIVVDQNYGVSNALQCVVFDPIDGDGNTRSCNIQSNVGSQEYKASMFVGSSKKGDPTAALRGCSSELKSKRSEEYGKAKTDKEAIIKSPGNLGQNNFNDTEINALKSVMGRLNRNNPNNVENETVHYPGLSIDITLNGVYGFEPGNAISSTQVPSKWRNSYKSYFMLTKVTHNFQNSDWSTQLSGILAYYNNINYIQL